MKKGLLFLIGAMFPIILFANEHEPLHSNYVYEISLHQTTTAYIFGSNHLTSTKVPVNLGRCVKELFKNSDDLFLESNMLDIIKLAQSKPKTQPMSAVSEHLNTKDLQFAADLVFGKDDPDNIQKVKALDAMQLLNTLGALIPNALGSLGQIDFGTDTELTMAARFFEKKLGFIETPEQQFAFFQRVSAEDYAITI